MIRSMQYAVAFQATSRQIALTLSRTSAKLSCHEGRWEQLREELPPCTHRHRPPEVAYQLIPADVGVRFADPEEACQVMRHASTLPDQLTVLAFDGDAIRIYVYTVASHEFPWVVVAYVGQDDLLALVSALANDVVRVVFKGIPVDCSPKDQ